MQLVNVEDNVRARIRAMQKAGKTAEEIALIFAEAKVVPGLGYNGEAIKIGATTYYL